MREASKRLGVQARKLVTDALHTKPAVKMPHAAKPRVVAGRPVATPAGIAYVEHSATKSPKSGRQSWLSRMRLDGKQKGKGGSYKKHTHAAALLAGAPAGIYAWEKGKEAKRAAQEKLDAARYRVQDTVGGVRSGIESASHSTTDAVEGFRGQASEYLQIGRAHV